MNIEKRFFTRDLTEQLTKPLGIVLHSDGGRLSNIDDVWNRINKSENSYHYVISKDRIIQTRSTNLKTSHCTHNKYRKKARDFFGGDICSKNDTPDNYTLSVLILHDNYDDGFETETMDSLIEFLAGLCNDFNFDPQEKLLRHSDLTNEKEKQCPSYFFEDDEDPDDLWRSFKHWVAGWVFANYN